MNRLDLVLKARARELLDQAGADAEVDCRAVVFPARRGIVISGEVENRGVARELPQPVVALGLPFFGSQQPILTGGMFRKLDRKRFKLGGFVSLERTVDGAQIAPHDVPGPSIPYDMMGAQYEEPLVLANRNETTPQQGGRIELQSQLP